MMRCMLTGLVVLMITGCSSHSQTCDDTTCRSQSDSHHVVIWWPSSMREGDQSFSKMPVR